MGKMTSLQYSESNQTLVGVSTKMIVELNPQTGELMGEPEQVQNVYKRIYGSRQFWKIYYMDLLMMLGYVVDTASVDVVIYVMENVNPSDNLFIGSFTDIASATGVCRKTVATVMKRFQEAGYLKKIKNGVWMANPDIAMKGNDRKRSMLISFFDAEEPINKINTTTSQKRKNTKKAINAAKKKKKEAES